MSIYKITNSENDFIYIGKTVKTLAKRLSEHEVDYGGWLNRGCRRYYVSSFEILKFDSYKIELIETVEDESLLSEREKYYINTIPCINIRHNRNLSSPTFLCPCGAIVDATNRHKHNKSPAHRRALRELHFKTKSIFHFIRIYKSSKTEYIPIIGGITLNIDCEPQPRKIKQTSGLVLNIDC